MTLGFRLTLKKMQDGRLSLSVPVFYRILLGAIGLLILLSILLTAPQGDRRLFAPANTVPLIVSLLSLLGALYHERWIFDRPHDAVTHRLGLAFVRYARHYRMSDLVGLELEGAHRADAHKAGLPFRSKGPILTLWLNGKDRSQHRLETYGPSQGPHAAEAARMIAAYCELPLQEGQTRTGDGRGHPPRPRTPYQNKKLRNFRLSTAPLPGSQRRTPIWR